MPLGHQEASKNFAPYINSDLFNATVTSCSPATMCVTVTPDGESGLVSYQAHSLSSTYSAALGFNETILPGIGTRVLCQGRFGDSTILVGALPNIEAQGDPNICVLANRSILGTREPVLDNVHAHGYGSHITKAAVLNNNLPTDVVQGEKVIANEFGIMLGLFKLMANLKASELAQIQVHFLDDLVRIISHNFQHYTSLGELKVFHDGQGIHLEVGATHRPNESMGISSESSITKLESNEGSQHLRHYKMSNEQLNMLERMKLFVGKLGDFVNFLLLKPADIEHTLDGTEPAKPDTGLLQIKTNLDGTLIVRSVSGIYLEKTNWIRVPQRIRTVEDPEGDDGKVIEYPDRKPYEFNEEYSSADAAYRETAFLYYLQLKDYLAYINEGIGYSNFKAHPKDFYVNDDIAKETKIDELVEVDPGTGVGYKKNKSWIALMNNGGISLADAWGSAINMEGGNIYIQPAKDCIVQPNRNYIAKIGGNMSIAAKREIDLSSTEGGLRIKTEQAQYLYSKNSGIVLHANGPAFENSVENYPETDVVAMVSGVVIKAPNAALSVSASQINQQAKHSVITQSTEITMRSKILSRLMSDGLVCLSAPTTANLSTEQSVNYSGGSNILFGMNSTLVGLKDQQIADISFMGGRIPVEGLPDPKDTKEKFIPDIQKMADELKEFDAEEALIAFKAQEDFDAVEFQFLPSSMYNASDMELIIPQTLSQQNDTIKNHTLQNWVESDVNSSYPYPGSDSAKSYIVASCSNISDVELANKAIDLISSSKAAFEVKDMFKEYKSI